MQVTEVRFPTPHSSHPCNRCRITGGNTRYRIDGRTKSWLICGQCLMYVTDFFHHPFMQELIADQAITPADMMLAEPPGH